MYAQLRDSTAVTRLRRIMHSASQDSTVLAVPIAIDLDGLPDKTELQSEPKPLRLGS